MQRYILSRFLAATLVSVSLLSASVHASNTFVIDPQSQFDITDGDYKGQTFAAPQSDNAALQDYEAQEVTQNAIPEPASWLLMIFGFAFIIAAGKRRRKTIDQFS